jgi:putative ABC transport system permease protein
MFSALSDFRYALRSFARTPGFTAVSVLALALGMGANTAIFSTINALLLKPLDFENAERMVVFWDNQAAEGRLYNEVTGSNISALRSARSFAQIGVWDYAAWTMTGTGEPEQLRGMVVSHELAAMLEVKPALGRSIVADDDRPGAAAVALLSNGLWQRRFAGDRNIVGRVLTLNGNPVTVVGVLPEGFHFGTSADLLVPIAAPDSTWQVRNAHSWRVVGLLDPDVSFDAARAELNTINAGLEQQYPDTHAGWRLSIQPLNEGMFQGPVKPVFAVLFGAVGFVLLIACADVANLSLARSAARRREVAIRTAIGASRSRIVRQMLSESLMLSLLGAGAGLVVATWGLAALSALIPPSILQFTPRLAELRIDGNVLLYTAGLCVFTALLFGLAPALRASSMQLTEALKDRDRGFIPGKGRHLLRSGLVVAEIALSLVLVTGAGLMVRSFVNQQRANPGFSATDLVTASIAPNPARYATPEALSALQTTLLERLNALREVESAATINALPLSGEAPSWDFTIEGRVTDPNNAPRAQARIISPQYLQVAGIPLQRGRSFTEDDRADAAPVAVVSRALADLFFPGQGAVGQRIRIPGEETPREIVGVAGNVSDWRLGITGPTANAFVYVPYAQRPRGRLNLIVRARAEAEPTFAAVRRTLFQIDPQQPLFQTARMSEVVREAMFSQRITASMLGVLALVALLLAVCGVYGVMAYAVTQRTYEFGVRQALGAGRVQLLRMVIGQGFAPVAIGVVLGIAGAIFSAQALRGMLFDVKPVDPAIFGGVTVLLLLVAFLATTVPALRALRIQPMIALRNE